MHITILKVVLEIKSLKHDDKQVTFLKMKANEFFKAPTESGKYTFVLAI